MSGMRPRGGALAGDGNSSGPAAGSDRLMPWLFWIFGLILIVPIWAGQHLPTEDGMAHLYWVDVFRALGHPGSAWEPFYERNVQWNTPNLGFFAIQYALTSVVEPHLALQIGLSLLLLCWIASIRFLAVSVNGKLSLGAMASLLLLHSSWLYGGFFGFLIGIPVLLVSLGILARMFAPDGSVPGVAGSFVVALLGIAGYYSHLVVAALFLLLGLAFGLFHARRSRRQVVYLGFALLPTGLLSLLYVLGGSSGLGGLKWEAVGESVAKFAGHAFFRGFAAPTLAFWVALALLEGILLALCLSVPPALRRGKTSRLQRLILALAVSLTVVYFIAPDRVGQGGNLKARVQFAMWAWLLPALPFRMSSRVHAGVLVAISAALAWQVAEFTARSKRFNRAYAEVLADAAPLPPGATVRSVMEYRKAKFEQSFIQVLAHFAEDIGYHERAVVVPGYHPDRPFYWVRPRPGADTTPAYRLSIDALPPSSLRLTIDAAPGPQASGGPDPGDPATAPAAPRRPGP